MKKGLPTITLLLAMLSFGVVLGQTNQPITVRVSDRLIGNVYTIQLHISVSEFSTEEISVNESVYQILTVPGYAHTLDIGKPQLPAIRILLAAPCISNVLLKTLKTEHSVLPGDYNMHPVQEPVYDSSDHHREFKIDTSFYSTDTFYPGRLAAIGHKGILRDYYVVELETFRSNTILLPKRLIFIRSCSSN